MKKFAKYISLLQALVMVTSLSLLSCGGGGGGGSGGGGGGGTSTIRGNVSGVIAMAPTKEKSSILAIIKNFFSFSKKANAKSSEVEGIEVIAKVNGDEVDHDTTDVNGNFVLTIHGSTNVTLIFIMGNSTVSVQIFAPEGTVVNVVVTLDQKGDDVIVEEMEIEGTIDCETGVVTIDKSDNTDFVIDGKGGDCIRVGGNCKLSIEPVNIELTNCNRCIRAEGTADVVLTTNDGDISCDATGDGISTVGNATVMLNASGSGDINILGNGNGISAVGTSEVKLNASGAIDISGNDNWVEARGTSLVELNGAACTIKGDVVIDGTATVNACGSPIH